MEFKDIATVSGKGGLFRVVKPAKTGVILESLDEKKAKLITGMQHKVSVLSEISIYTTGQEDSVPLEIVLRKIKEEFDEDPGVDKNSDPEELKSFLAHILPDYDRERVYVSDIKKLVSWYLIINKQAPELLTSAPQEAEADKES